jgi:hypothetical protein
LPEGPSGGPANLCGVGRRTLPLALVLAAALADVRGAHGIAFYLVVAAVPAAAVCALTLLGHLVELPGGAPSEAAVRLEATLSGLGLLLVVVAAAAHANAGVDRGVPPIGVSALLACLLVVGAQWVVALAVPALAGKRSPAALQ